MVIAKAPDSDLEDHYLRFADRISVRPDNKARSYWLTPVVSDWLDGDVSDTGESPHAAEIDAIRADPTIEPTTKDALIRARIGQGLFRRSVIKTYKKCLITEVEQEGMLVASHIKPWKDCHHDPAECLSPDNALLLTPTWDALFDKGFISFSKDGELMLSETLKKQTKVALGIPKKKTVDLTVGQRAFMKFHRRKFDFEPE